MKCEWKTVDLGDICRFQAGNAFPKKEQGHSNGDIPFIKVSDMNLSKNTRKIYTANNWITKSTAARMKLRLAPKESIVFAKIGEALKAERLRELVYDTAIDNNLMVAIPNQNIEKGFINFILENIHLARFAEGSALPFLRQGDLEEISISLPPKREQKKIVAILRALDDKIELNNKINENLEQQARLLFERWMSKNNEYYQLYPLCQVAVINSDAYSPKYKWEYVNYLDTSSIKDGIIYEIQNINLFKNKLPSRARRIIHENDIVFSTVRPNQHHFGIINNPLKNMLVSTGFAVIRSNNKKVCNEVIYMCLTNDSFIDKMQQLAEQSTSTFPAIKPSDLGECKIPCPVDQDLVDTLKIIFTTIFSKQSENQSLSAIRDTLFPKLMSGELDVSELDI